MAYVAGIAYVAAGTPVEYCVVTGYAPGIAGSKGSTTVSSSTTGPIGVATTTSSTTGATTSFFADLFFFGFLEPLIVEAIAPPARQQQNKANKSNHCQICRKDPEDPDA
jgi:hypothetical protein